MAKRLIIRLTPAGRGCVVTHALYLDQEMEKVRREASALHVDEPPVESSPSRPGLGSTASRAAAMPLEPRRRLDTGTDI